MIPYDLSRVTKLKAQHNKNSKKGKGMVMVEAPQEEPDRVGVPLSQPEEKKSTLWNVGEHLQCLCHKCHGFLLNIQITLQKSSKG